jgi:cation:H+ antiporter
MINFFLDVLMLLFGMLILFYGGNWLVDGSVSISHRFGIRPMIIGLTVVAFGTSAPELVVSLIAAFQGTNSVAVGNVIGSNIANIGLILGVAALIRPMAVNISQIRGDYFFALGASIFCWMLCFDYELQRWDGLALLCGLCLFFVWTLRDLLRKQKNGAALESIELQTIDVDGAGAVSDAVKGDAEDDAVRPQESTAGKSVALVMIGMVHCRPK